MQNGIIPKLMLYEFKLVHNAEETTKNICYAKSEGAVDYSPVIRLFQKFHLGYKNVDDQARSGWPKIVDSETTFQAIVANQAINNRRRSGELGISQSSVVCHLHDLGKSMQNHRILSYNIKILQNFWITLVSTS